MAQKIDSISEAHELLGLPKPQHPLISLVDNEVVKVDPNKLPSPHILGFYKISFRRKFHGKIKYGQGYYDFDEGGMFFAGPNQLIGVVNEEQIPSGYVLVVHPDFLRNTSLAAKIKQYGFFSYDVNEVLHLSEKERNTIISIFKDMEEELSLPIDEFSQDIVVSQFELLLNYSNRYYKRQFITRKVVNSSLLQKLEDYLDVYLENKRPLENGIPTVQLLADQVNFSPSYLSDMLRTLTGRNAQQFIHDKVIEKAKELLSTTTMSVSEISYQLGFEHSQSFSRLFKSKMEVSPLEFRRSFN